MLLKYSFAIYLCIGVVFIISNSAIEFGSFDLHVTDFEVCKGPKRIECSEVNVSITDQNKLDYSIYVKENMIPTKGKITALVKGKETFRLQIKNPCDHLFLRPLLHSMLNISKDCMIEQGHYHFYVDVEDIATRYYGGDFIYGKWTFKSMFYNDHCNLSCSVTKVEIAPKNKTLAKN